MFPFAIVMPIIFVFGIYFMKKYVFDLVDEVMGRRRCLGREK